MSKNSPLVALCADWSSSDMFRDEATGQMAATHGERLAWVELLCDVRIRGRGGEAGFHPASFAARYHLSMRSVEGMMALAQKCGAAEFSDGMVRLANFKAYHSRLRGSEREEQRDLSPLQKRKNDHSALSSSGLTDGGDAKEHRGSQNGALFSSGSPTKDDQHLNRRRDIIQEIYDAYPRKVGAKAAKLAIERAAKHISIRPQFGGDVVAAQLWLLERCREYAASPLVLTTPAEFIPHATTWFNQGRYDDDASVWNNARGAAGRVAVADPTQNAIARRKASEDAIQRAATLQEKRDGQRSKDRREIPTPW